MNISKLSIITALAMMVTGNTAVAADLFDDRADGSYKDTGNYSLKDTGYEAPASGRQWYWRFDLGVGFNDEPDVKDNLGSKLTSQDWDENFLTGSGIGLYLPHRFRADLTLDRRYESDFSAYYPGAGASSASTVEIESLVGLANLYYDLDMGYSITPYVGVGIGFAHTEFDAHDLYDDDNTEFAWALMAGINYHISDRLSLDIGYRYLNMNDATLKITPAAKPSPYPVADNVHLDDLESHELRIGLRYNISCLMSCSGSAFDYGR